METSVLVLTNFCVLDGDSRKAKFSFKLSNYSLVSKNRLSRYFYFGGHKWKLQVNKQDGDYLGIFLRWYGTSEKSKKSENQETMKLSCSASLKFSVINRFIPEISVSEGKRNETDVFKRLGGGIGYSRIISLQDLENTPGFLVCNNLYLQLTLKICKTNFYNILTYDPSTDKRQETKSDEFYFYGAKWNVIFYPEGEKVDDTDDDDESGNSTNSSIYLVRETLKDNDLLRHNVRFMLFSSNENEFTVEQHFHNNGCNAFGSAAFPPIKDGDDPVNISLEFLNIVPYFYFAYQTVEIEKELSFGGGLHFADYLRLPWYFQFYEVARDKPIDGKLTLLENCNMKRLEEWTHENRSIAVSWAVDILNPIDIDESVTFVAKRKRCIRDSLFQTAGSSTNVEFPITSEQLFSEDKTFLDEFERLSIRITILCANSIEEISPDEMSRIYQEMCKHRESQQKENVHQLSIEEETIHEDPSENEKEIDENTDVLIRSLYDCIDDYEKYVKQLEIDPEKAISEHEERSITRLKSKARPLFRDYNNLILLAKNIERIIKTLPLEISKVVYAGALGQGTVVGNNLQVDFIVHLKDYKKQKHRLKVILEVMKERIREHSSKNPSDMLLDRSTCETVLPYSCRFYRTHKGLLFKTGPINVTLLLSRCSEIFDSHVSLYENSSKADNSTIYKYITLTAEKQIEFIDKQTHRCKDLICVVKRWSDEIHWKNAGSRPSSYLLSLLIISAYEKLQNKSIATTPSFDKAVLTEFALNVYNDNLYIEWDYCYKPSDYPLSEVKRPMLRDPTLPYHNVCETGISDWKQFREELDLWIVQLAV